MAVDVGSAVGYLDLDISGFVKNLQTAQSEAEGTSKSMSSKLETAFTTVGNKLTSAGKVMTAAVTTPIVGFGTAAVKITADFESAMSKVSAISGATGDDLTRLSDKAKEMGAKTKFSARESAEAFEYMAMAGWKTEDMIDGIDGVMALAAASGEDLATTSDIVTDALTAFGLKASDSAHFADVLAKASANANTDVSMLGESFKYVAPVAGALGYSAEDTAVALGLMANAGIKGSAGGTALRTSLSRLIKPTGEVESMMKKYNLSLTNSDGSMKSLGEVMDMFRSNLGGLSDAEQAAAASTLFGQEAMSGMLAIINASSSDYDKLTDSIYNADGAAQQMADTMLDNLSGQITLLKSALESLSLEIGEILVPYVKKAVEHIRALVEKLQSLSPEQKEQVVRIAAIVAAIGPCLLAIGKLTKVVGSLMGTFSTVSAALPKIKSAFTAVGAAIGGISAPVLIVIGVIATLTAAFVHLWQTNEDFRNKVTEIWDGLKAKFEEFTSGIVERINALGFEFESIIDVIKAAWDGLCNMLAPVLEVAFSLVSTILGTILDELTGLLDIFIGLFTGNWEQCWTGVKEIFSGAWEGITTIITTVFDALLQAAESVVNWFSENWNNAWENVKNFFIDTWNSIKDFFDEIGNSIKDGTKQFVDDVVKFFKELPYNIGLIIGEILGSIAKFVVDMVAKANELGKNFVEAVVSFFKQLPGKIEEFLNSAHDKAKKWVTDMSSRAKEAAKNFLDNVVNGIKNLPNNVKTTTDKILTNVQTWAKNLASKAREAAKQMSNNIVNGIKSLPNQVLSIGRNIVYGLWNGIAGASNWLYNKVRSFANGIITGIKSALGIASPSRVMRDQVGAFLPPGISAGFDKAMPGMLSNMKDKFNDGIRRLRGQLEVFKVDGIVTGDVSFDPNIGGHNSTFFIDYDILAQKLADVLRQAPIAPQVNVDMQDGDVYFDNERVGRKVAPVVSRVIAQET